MRSAIGVLTASALKAVVGQPERFANGRRLSAWLGMTPREFSSGERRKLGHISRQGNTYVRTLLIHGARAALLAAQMELQSAGFGMPATASLEDRVVISEAGKRVVWRFLEGAQGRCAGLQVETHGISRLPAKDCNGLASVSWNANEQQPMARMPTNPDGSVFTLADEVGGMSLAAGYAFHLSGAPVNCLPYMQQSDAGSLPAGRTLDLKSGDGSSVLFSVCLPNLAVVNA